MKEIWDFENGNLVDHAGRITFEGLATNWQSVDAAVCFNVIKHEMAYTKIFSKSLANAPKVVPVDRQKHPTMHGYKHDKMKDFF